VADGQKDVAHKQILMASNGVLEGEWECAITLAGGAEGLTEKMEKAVCLKQL